ncbi:carbohydrate-binding family 9-like protein [Carboxylicivirga marina]|uniref:Carbohydrate-binding family 9-like protein n=1 Tax=Carboxylicivirga marina TaxID=2800988 RepID=A0ABS1HNQ3_9BACT|nr:carbohydrate-binding family 9-like protein [Carboxylicivirga marina]MBK3519318.1 carbohydrate-binding family 9-like protein [Carboxylicivirga marina]
MSKLLLISLLMVACLPIDKHEGDTLDIAPFHPESYVCYRTKDPLIIDGNLDEDAWQNTAWTNLFVDIQGDKKPRPKYNTKAKMLWDDEYLYVAAFMEEPHLWASITERDAVIFYDNDFEVFIDPNGDTHGYYEYEVNAFNTVWDLLLAKPYRDGGPAINNWDINGLKSAVKLIGTVNQPDDIDEGWFVEIAFPLKVLHEYCGGVPAKGGNQWRINFSRVQWQLVVEENNYVKRINSETGKHYPEDNWVWSPQGFINMHRPETWGFIQFSDVIAGQGDEAFEFNKDELVKWELYKVYYAQKLYYKTNGAYAQELNQLNNLGLSNLKYVKQLESTTSLFEGIASRLESDYNWHINNEGRTWKTKK